MLIKSKMIISYINTEINSIEYQQRVDSLSEICEMFFTEIDKDIKIITERNPIIIRDLIIYYKPIFFFIDSIKDFPFSPTLISELIIFILNHNCIFESKDESISFDKNNIVDVYPKIFSYYKRESNSN